MSLTVALAIVGVLVLGAVVAHGVWQARRAGPRLADAPPPTAAEPRGPVRVEPTLGDGTVGAPDDAAASAAMNLAADPPAAPIASGARAGLDDGLPDVKAAPRRSLPKLDALIDAIVPLTLDAPVAGEFAIGHLPASHRAGSKPFFVEGLDTETGEWETPAHGRHYGEFQAGVQMANRGGPINEIEYSEFVQKVEAFAEAIGARAEPPDMLDVVARARELDAFAGAHDAQLAVHLVAQGAAWSVGFLAQHAARHGFVPGAVPGRLVLPATEDGAPPVLTLAFDPQAALADDPAQAVVSDVILALDVPQTASSAEPFAQWQEAARALAADLGASLTDDAGQPLNLHAFAAIGKDLVALYAALEARDLAAGSAAARRLFS